LDDHLGHLVVALTEAVMADLPLCIDEVQRRPVVVAERIPDPIVAVDRDRIGNPQVVGGSADALSSEGILPSTGN
jgi:hypothetical protein